MMSYVVHRNINRVSQSKLDLLKDFGVATAHEAYGRKGLVGTSLHPRIPGSLISGSAVTVLSHPGDNLMIHVAVEQCKPGDVLVVTTTSESTDGMFGDLLATSLMARGVVGLIINAGVRDIAALRELPFPVWSKAVHAQGTVKGTPGSVNIPIAIDGLIINPGDAIIADDDGVMAIRNLDVDVVIEASAKRVANEAEKRAKLASGILGLDMYNLRPLVESLGIKYLD